MECDLQNLRDKVLLFLTWITELTLEVSVAKYYRIIGIEAVEYQH